MNETIKIEPGSLAEHLYNRYGVRELEELIDNASLKALMHQWTLSDEQCKKQIELAIHYISQD